MGEYKKVASTELLIPGDKPEEGLSFLQNEQGMWSLYPVGCFLSLVTADGTAYPHVLMQVKRTGEGRFDLVLRCACHQESCTAVLILHGKRRGHHPVKEQEGSGGAN